MRRALLALALPGLLVACGEEGGGPAPVAMAGAEASIAEKRQAMVETLDTTELATLLESGEVVLVDVRTPEEFAAGRLPGALNAPVETFDATSIPMEEGRETILYCRSGNRSAQAAQMLAEHTGGTVRHLEGGIVAWEDAGEEVIAPDT